MNESAAREIALVRAIEVTDRSHQLVSAEDRQQANQGARERSHWQASQRASAVTSSLFLEQRAKLVLDRLGQRFPPVVALRRPARWHGWVGIGSAITALVVGAFAERIVNPHRVDLLSGALLLIVAWNLLVYLGLLLWPLLARRFGAAAPALVPPGVGGWLARHFERVPKPDPALAAGELGPAALAFSRDWARVSAPLTAARVARILHLAAALFAIGAIASLYARGIVSEYRVGWESTFLDAKQVHALLSIVFWPVVKLAGMAPFGVEQVAALQFSQPPQPASGARWVHMYAALLTLVVVLPRLALAALAWLRERRLARSFALDLGEPYFRRLLAAAGQSGGSGAALVAQPYSFRVDPARAEGLRAVAAQLLGGDARLELRPSIDYGADVQPRDLGGASAPASDHTAAAPALTLALFNLAATPEHENHGALLDRLAAAAPRRSAVLIDESSFSERLGGGAGAATRLKQRRELWRHFCDAHGLPVAFIDLLSPSLDGIEHDLGPRVAAAAA